MKNRKKIIFLGTLLASWLVLTWCLWKTIGDTSVVSIKYTASFEDGSVFQTWQLDNISINDASLVQWVQEWLIGMKKWSKKIITVTPEMWYGKYYDKAKIQKIAKELIWNDTTWAVVKIWNDDVTIVWFEWDLVVLDINPKNTRENLVYEVDVVDVK